MRFKLTTRFLLFAGLCVCLTSGEPWLRQGLAAQESRIAFSSLAFDNFEIYVMDADGGNRENLSNHPVDDRDPDWSPDGTKIAFVSNRNDGVYQVYVMDADGSNQIRLTDGPQRKQGPDWSPDGQQIAFTVHLDLHRHVDLEEGDLFPHIAIMDSNGNNRERFENDALGPSWSPDGGQIAFVSGRDGGAEIYVIGTDGQGLERVTHGLLGGQSPSFSPDGGRIAYHSWNEEFHQIYVVGADGKNRMRLTHNEEEHHVDPTWSPDGGTIAYAVANDKPFESTIHLMTADGKHLKQLSGDHDGIDDHPDFSPVGLAVSPTAVSPAFKTATLWGRVKKLKLNRR